MSNKDAGSDNLNKLAALIHPHFSKIAGQVVSKDLSQESWANAEGVAADLMAKSKVIRERVQKGEVEIKTALYNVDTGAVDFGGK
jgi:carbonic anhydrase